MNKTAIKNYAVWARAQLIEAARQQAYRYEVREKGENKADLAVVNGQPLTGQERAQRNELIRQIHMKGYAQVMEEVAYTWFNRFIALRFMEVNGFLPARVRLFSDEAGSFKPEILTQAMHVDLAGLDREKVYRLLDENKSEELYKYLLITQCNALNAILPGMFQRIADYTELLFPGNLLHAGSVLEQLVQQIDAADWQDQVQIIGWLYQYYNSEPKDRVFANLKKNIKISKQDIPAATQLFTPDWIVRYMVENSLGRLWVEGHPNDSLKASWTYYLEEAEQEPAVQARLTDIRKDSSKIRPEQIKVIDPCMGSGHILAYLFDVLMQVYEAGGYPPRDAVRSIIENNLYGLDIDERAAQLAYFSVMMKARQYDPRFFTRKGEDGAPDIPQPQVMAVRESNSLSTFEQFKAQLSLDTLCVETANLLITAFQDAREYGSLLKADGLDLSGADRLMQGLRAINGDFMLMQWIEQAENLLPQLAAQGRILQQKYDIVVTNPPYMGAGGMGAKLSAFVKMNYPDSKSDLFAVFMERCGEMTKAMGLLSMITQHAWMFLSSYEKLRGKLQKRDLINMAHLGARAFEEVAGEVVQTTAFVQRQTHTPGYQGTYARLIEPTTQQGKEDLFLAGENRYTASQGNFSKIPGAPVAYWASQAILSAFEKGVRMDFLVDPRQGLATADNDRFIRLWHEVFKVYTSFDSTSAKDALSSGKKWFPYNKGGARRQWYGNYDYLVNWEKDGKEIKSFKDVNGKVRSRPQNTGYYFLEAITWGLITSGGFSIRYRSSGGIHDVSGMSAFTADHSLMMYLLALMSTHLADHVFKMVNPTINLQIGDFNIFPVLREKRQEPSIIATAETNIRLAQEDWDSFETSWDFKRHPLIGGFR